VLLSIGEMIKEKTMRRHECTLQLNNRIFIYLICGRGELEGNLKEMTKKLE
jgi:hypothetical protein